MGVICDLFGTILLQTSKRVHQYFPRYLAYLISLRQPVVQKLSQHTIGMVDLPLFSQPTLKQELSGHAAVSVTLEQLESMADSQREKYVLVVQDPFTSYYDAKVVADFVRLIELGLKPVLLPFSPNGKAQHIKGFLAKFAKTARKTADF